MGTAELWLAGQRQRRRAAPYRASPAAIVQPLSAGLFAVYTPIASSTRVFYCEPATGRCSCGAPAGSCPHIAATIMVDMASRRPAPLP